MHARVDLIRKERPESLHYSLHLRALLYLPRADDGNQGSVASCYALSDKTRGSDLPVGLSCICTSEQQYSVCRLAYYSFNLQRNQVPTATTLRSPLYECIKQYNTYGVKYPSTSGIFVHRLLRRIIQLSNPSDFNPSTYLCNRSLF